MTQFFSRMSGVGTQAMKCRPSRAPACDHLKTHSPLHENPHLSFIYHLSLLQQATGPVPSWLKDTRSVHGLLTTPTQRVHHLPRCLPGAHPVPDDKLLAVVIDNHKVRSLTSMHSNHFSDAVTDIPPPVQTVLHSTESPPPRSNQLTHRGTYYV